MLGLIKKDLLIIKSNLKLIIAMLFIFLVMTLQGQFDISFIPPFIVVMLFMTTFSYDEYNKWDTYAITLPNGRKNMVKSKYIASIILIVLSIAVTVLLNSLITITNNTFEFDRFISTLAGSGFALICIQAIMYPFIFKFGIEKGRIGLFVLAFAIVGIVKLLSEVIKFDIPENIITLFNNLWFIIIPVLAICILFVSYKISEKIYLKKEF